MATICITISACSSHEGLELNGTDSTAIKQSDSLVKSDKQRSDSMMKALKEKLK